VSRHHPRCKGPRRCTLGWYSKEPAEIVRAKRWRVGDLIVGLEDSHVAVLRLTAVGECEILASALYCIYIEEHTWYLAARCWVRVPAKLAAEYVAGDTAQRSALLPRLVSQ